MPTPRRLVPAAAAAVLGVLLAASPAAAVDEPTGPPVNERNASSGKQISIGWREVGRLPGGVLGNYHDGWLTVERASDGGEAYVFGDVTDFECPPGVTPDDGWGGGHGEEPEEPEGPLCEVVASRTIEEGDLTVVADARNRNARITGTLAVTDHGTPLGNPAVDIRLRGGKDTFADRWSNRYTEGGVVYSSTYSSHGRAATVTGRIGPMVFDDAEGEYSSATLATWSQVSRVRVR